MNRYVRSIITSGVVAGTVFFSISRLVAPHLPPYVGPADLRVSKTVRIPATPQFRLNNGDGAVEILTAAPAESDSIRIESDIRGYIHAHMASDEAREWTDALVTTEQRNGESIVVTHPVSPPPGIDFVVDYRITLPAGTNVEIIGGNGNILIHEGCGIVEARGINADIKINDPDGRVVAESVNGRITVRDIVADAQIETVNGDVHASAAAGQLFAVSTNGGVYARLIGNDVESANLTSHNGPVSLEVPAALGLELTAVGPPGSLGNGLGLQDAVPDSGKISTTIGDGRTMLNLETTTGTIAMKRRP